MKKFATLRRALADMSTSANISSREFAAQLKDFGFVLNPRTGRGHVTVTHPAFMLGPDDEANYNGGHSAGDKINRPYVKHFLSIVDDNKDALEKHLT